MLTGENGILTQVQKAKNETENAQTEEENILSDYENYLSQYTNGGYVESKGVNVPVLKGGMELVTYNEETGNWETNNSSSAYDYVAGEGTEDNNSSKWANAKVTIGGIDSYFVWIPRYAYKITYNNPEDISAGGTIDVKFLKGTSNIAADGTVCKYADDSTLNKEIDYIIHPAFTSNVDLGGWRNELTGIWVGKYESSLVNKEDQSNIVTNDEGTGNILLSKNTDKAIAIQPGMSSWRYCTIGNMYTNAREYAENLNSHMLKNSEWGAVAYLTNSQYGRNGHEVTINNSENFITGFAGIDISATKEEGGTDNYSSKQGVLASSTGNVYGIYDLSGGAWETTTSYYQGGKTLGNTTFANGKNNQYSTVYESDNEENYKCGDATYEVNDWNGDESWFVNEWQEFFRRGGCNTSETFAGVNSFSRDNSNAYSATGFRIALMI